jgi:hypothetical protein
MEWLPDTSSLAAAGAVAFGAAAYRVAVRPRLWGVRVQCWFCPSALPVVVPYSLRNSWTCEECGQYNGFTADGDFNRQVSGSREAVVRSGLRRDPGASEPRDNGLCQTCNLNQTLKTHQLARFKPSSAAAYDREVEAYAKHLEDAYRLCRRCEAILHQTLGEQDSWLRPTLLSWKLESNRSGPRQASAYKEKQRRRGRLPSLFAGTLRTLRLVTAIASFALLFVLSKYGSAAASTFACTIMSLWGVTALRKFKEVFKIPNVVALISWIIASWTLTNHEYAFLPTPLAITLCLALSVANTFRRRPRSAAVSRPKASQTAAIQRAAIANKLSDTAKNHNGRVHLNPAASDDGASTLHMSDVDVTLTGNGDNDGYKEDCDISTLSLDDDEEEEELKLNHTPPNRQSSTSPTFSLRTYSPGSVDFGFRRPAGALIRPARFAVRSPSKGGVGVVKASWVAGGYWQRTPPEPEAENLSRASSQSSGFISQSGSMNKHGINGALSGVKPPGVADELTFSFQQSNPFAGHTSMNAAVSRAGSLCASESASQRLDTSGLLNNSVISHCHSNASLKRRVPPRGSPEQSELMLSAPRAESSPVPHEKSVPLLERRVNLNCSLHSLLLVASIVMNLSLVAYFTWPTLSRFHV